MPIFSVGSEYKVVKDFTSGPSTFRQAEVLVFERDGFSPYDNSFVYEFRTKAGGEVKLWLLQKGDSAETWQSYFVQVNLGNP